MGRILFRLFRGPIISDHRKDEADEHKAHEIENIRPFLESLCLRNHIPLIPGGLVRGLLVLSGSRALRYLSVLSEA
jgi:hypothetical protein